MVTLLLTFFVLLLTLADVQDPELFMQGRDSFWESIRYCGLGALLGAEMSLDLPADRSKHPTPKPETTEDRTGLPAANRPSIELDDGQNRPTCQDENLSGLIQLSLRYVGLHYVFELPAGNQLLAEFNAP